jgi:hypothetical protein
MRSLVAGYEKKRREISGGARLAMEWTGRGGNGTAGKTDGLGYDVALG